MEHRALTSSQHTPYGVVCRVTVYVATYRGLWHRDCVRGGAAPTIPRVRMDTHIRRARHSTRWDGHVCIAPRAHTVRARIEKNKTTRPPECSTHVLFRVTTIHHSHSDQPPCRCATLTTPPFSPRCSPTMCRSNTSSFSPPPAKTGGCGALCVLHSLYDIYDASCTRDICAGRVEHTVRYADDVLFYPVLPRDRTGRAGQVRGNRGRCALCVGRLCRTTGCVRTIIIIIASVHQCTPLLTSFAFLQLEVSGESVQRRPMARRRGAYNHTAERRECWYLSN